MLASVNCDETRSCIFELGRCMVSAPTLVWILLTRPGADMHVMDELMSYLGPTRK